MGNNISSGLAPETRPDGSLKSKFDMKVDIRAFTMIGVLLFI